MAQAVCAIFHLFDSVSVHMIRTICRETTDGRLCKAMAHIDCHKQTPRSDCNCPSAVADGDGGDPVVDGDGEDQVVDEEAWAGASGEA